MIDLLHRWGYNVHWSILNTKEHGIPQSRPRFYLVALRKQVRAFTFPPTVAPRALADWLEGKHAERAVGRKYGKSTLASMEAGKEKLRAMGHDTNNPRATHAVIDIASSPRWSTVMIGCSPCLTAARCKSGGHYLPKFSRTMSMAEICRLQGIPEGRFDFEAAKVSKCQFLHAVGNAMSSNVVARLLAHTLFAAGLIGEQPVPDGDAIFDWMAGQDTHRRQ